MIMRVCDEVSDVVGSHSDLEFLRFKKAFISRGALPFFGYLRYKNKKDIKIPCFRGIGIKILLIG